MRALLILALSLLAHAAALHVVAEHSEPARPLAKTVAKVEIIEPVEALPVEVTLLDDDTATAIPDQPPVRLLTSQGRARQTTEVTTTTTERPTTTTKPPVSTTETKKRSMLSMRDDLHRPGSDGISDEMLEQMVNGMIPVRITNLPGAQAATQAKKAVELVEQKDGTYASAKKTFKANVNRDGTVALTDKPNWQWKSLFYAEFDATDGFMRGQGQDPYASEKRKFLDRTRDQRVEIGKRYRAGQLAQSAHLMARNLARLWATTSDPAKRKDELFALWDECAETGNEELVTGAAEARRILINWVETNHVEFTPAELAAFNARKQSKATFAP